MIAFGVECWAECHHVVCATLHRTELWSGAWHVGLDEDRQWTNTTGEVVADGRVDDVQQRLVARRGSCTDVGSCSDEGRPDVQRTWAVGRKGCVSRCRIDDELAKQIGTRWGRPQLGNAQEHPLDRIVEAEDRYRTIDLTMSLQSFETLARIMQHMGGGVHRETF